MISTLSTTSILDNRLLGVFRDQAPSITLQLSMETRIDAHWQITQSTSISRVNVRISVEETDSTTPFKYIDSLLISSSERPRTYQILVAHPACRGALNTSHCH